MTEKEAREWKRDHGGNVEAYRRAYGAEPLDFSSNVAPLGVPDTVRLAAEKSLPFADRYPDPDCIALREALSEKLSVPKEELLCGSGAADLIFRFALAIRAERVLIPSPTFSEYGKAARLSGAEVVSFPLSEEEDFLLTDRLLEAITGDIGAVFLCEPNNPTGRTAGRELLLLVLRRCEETGAYLFLDECFLELLDEPDAHTLLPEICRHPGLILLRAFTKLYGMAGLRLGYCISSNERLLSDMKKAGPPWNVSTAAQAAGVAALSDTEYKERVRSLIQRERPRLSRELSALGLRVIPGEANFLLFQAGEELSLELRKQGILIRDCSSFEGLGSGWYRVAVRRMEENERLVETIRALSSGGH